MLHKDQITVSRRDKRTILLVKNFLDFRFDTTEKLIIINLSS